MKLNKFALIVLTIGVSFTSCSNDDDAIPVVPLGAYENGIIISEEGNFTGGTGAITFVSNDLETVENNVYNNVNSETLGNTVQSMAFNGDRAYIIENGSNAIKVVNRYTFEAIATIESSSMVNPRYMAISNGKGYVTNWGDFNDTTDDKVLIVDLGANTILEAISTNYLPEEIIATDNRVYVATGIFGFGDQVDVINSITDTIVTSVTVGNSPNSIQFDSEGDIWVLSSNSLVEINKDDNTVIQTLDFIGVSSPSKLYYSNQNFYYHLNSSIYKIAETATSLPNEVLFDFANLYDLSVRGNQFFGLNHNGFSGETSFLKVIDLDTNTEIKSIDLGPFGGEVYFN